MAKYFDLHDFLFSKMCDLLKENPVITPTNVHDFIFKVEGEIQKHPQFFLRNGISYIKRSPNDPIRVIKDRIMKASMLADERDTESHVWYSKFLKLIEEIEKDDRSDERQTEQDPRIC